MRSVEVIALCVCSYCGGCAAAPAPRAPTLEVVSTVVVSRDEVVTVSELLARADSEMRAAHYPEAARLYALSYERDVSGLERARAKTGEAVASELAGDSEGALAAYVEAHGLMAPNYPVPYFEGGGGFVLGRERLVARAIRLTYFVALAGPEKIRPGDLEDLAGRLEVLVGSSETEELPRLDRLSIAGFRLSRATARGEEALAAKFQRKGDMLAADLGLAQTTRLPIEAVPFYFAKADALAARASNIHFDPFPSDFAAVLEERCALLLEAQSAYVEVMRATHPRYSAWAGVRTAKLYELLHHDLLAMQRPPEVTPERAALFEAAIRLRYRILLDKAEKLLSHTLALAEKSNLAAELSEVTLAHDRLTKWRAEEEAWFEKLPFPVASLEEALAEMRADSGSRGPHAGRAP